MNTISGAAIICQRLLATSAMLVGAVAAHAQPAAVPPASPQDANPVSGVEEIVVTAQKRAENVQNVPIAITAVTGETLRARNITSVQSLVQSVPAVTFGNSNSEARISIRGIGYDGLGGGAVEARAAYHVDGVYIARTGEVFGTFYDVNRVEVLRGPQGTLFGRNAVSGTVNLITRDPTNATEGFLQADVGNYGAVRVEGAISGEIANNVSARIAFKTENRDGFDHNIPNDTDINDLNTRAVRGKLKFQPTPNFSLILAADYFRERDRVGFQVFGLYDPATLPPPIVERLGGTLFDDNPRHDYADFLPLNERKYWSTSATADLALGSNYGITSIASYRHGKENFRYDIDGGSLPLFDSYTTDTSKQFSEELRLRGKGTRYDFVVGGYMFTQDITINQLYPIDFSVLAGSLPLSGLLDGIQLGGRQKDLSLAAFAQGNYQLTDWLKITAGARYSWERKKKINEYFQFDLSGPFNPNDAPKSVLLNDTNTYKNFSPRVTATVSIDPTKSVYATYSKGFRSGGYNLGFQNPPFFPEKITDYEGGFKTEFFDRRLKLNGAAFIYKYNDLQVNKEEAAGTIIANAATADIRGLELEFQAIPMTGLRLDGSASLLKSKFTRFDTFDSARPGLGQLDLSGNRLPSAPKYTLSYGLQYTIPTNHGEFTFRGEGRSISDVYFDQFNRKENSERAYSIFNAYINWVSPDKKLYGSLWMRNIGNILTKNSSLIFAGLTGYNIEGTYDPPRTYGLELGVRF